MIPPSVAMLSWQAAGADVFWGDLPPLALTSKDSVPNHANSPLSLGMGSPIRISIPAWRKLVARLENALGLEIAPTFRTGQVDVEAMVADACARTADPSKLGLLVAAFELRLGLASLLGISASEITPDTEMRSLMPHRNRKQLQTQLQAESDWILPRLGLPIWAQSVWGAALLVGFVLQFIYPLWGMGLFWGGMLLSFQVEKAAWAFQYPTFGKWVERVVKLNWPSLELGALDDDRVRLALADLLDLPEAEGFDPRQPFPTVLVRAQWPQQPAQIQVLNGDSLREALQDLELPGVLVVMRECMIVGPVAPAADFAQRRAAFVEEAYGASPAKYAQWITSELEKIYTAPADTELNLWFEDDLFCQTNLWYLLHGLAARGRAAHLYRVMPAHPVAAHPWAGFGGQAAWALEDALAQRVALSEADVQLGARLWAAYQQDDVAALQAMAAEVGDDRPAWPRLAQVIAAHIDRLPPPIGGDHIRRRLRALRDSGVQDFEAAFAAFSQEAGIYGLGDAQVRLWWNEG